MELPKTNFYLECKYPYLAADGYEIKGPDTNQYNCASVPEGDYCKWTRPHPSTEGLISYFESKNWRICEDGEQREGYFKLAIYVGITGIWTHVSVRQKNGKWLSKLGKSFLIEHNTVRALEGFKECNYGVVKYYMERRRRPNDP